ncbi:hypothetical protein PWY87_23775 [Kribbella solani]|uniref:hypothetical protein n=1 Tax=Kribbella solani TaxID=236067 RepID=UPI0029B4CD20|nr:hypothetical protein [Kribbella solani]MDX2970195.1 hypothetical protein [Kribbella solani]MDX3004726.1 hypothetical protein [Kribbella solani]
MTRVDHRRVDHRRVDRRKAPARAARPQRSRSAVSAAIVAAAAMAAAFAFILTRGTSADPPAAGPPTGTNAAAPSTPTADSATKADRKPPVSAPETTVKAQTTTPPAVNTGPVSPKFKRGEWIAVLDKYPTDVGLAADQAAKDTATKLSRAGVPAKAMLVDGQYPGLTNSSLTPVTATWVVYLGPGTSSEQMLNLCLDPRTQRVYPSPACPTYEPAATRG